MTPLDYLVIGAGPAGLQLAYFLDKSNSNYVVLEKADVAGSFFKEFPRHRKLISINKVYVGTDDPELKMRWDWNSLISDDPTLRLEKYSKDYFPSADYLVEYLKDYADQYGLNINYNSEVAKIEKENGIFVVTTVGGKTYHAKVVVVGTGIFKPFIPEIEGIELCDNYTTCSVDTDDFINKRVLVVGKGNSAFETADHLVGVCSAIHVASPNSLKFAWQTHFVGHLRAVNNNFLDTYQLKSQNAIIDAVIEKVEKKGDQLMVTFKYAHANDEVETIVYDNVILATGFQFDDSIFGEDVKPALAINDRFPEQTCEWESSNVDNLYFIGAVTQQRDFKKHTSAFIHGFRYNVQCLYHLLKLKYENVELPNETVEFGVKSFANQMMKQINKTSALWQQFGFICDLLAFNPTTREANYYDTVPTDFIHDSERWKNSHQFILTLEYGHFDEDENVFASNRIRRDEVDVSQESKFLHPVIRHYYKGQFISEHHMIEVLEAVWDDYENHQKPLEEYLEKELARYIDLDVTREKEMMTTTVGSM